MTITAHKNRSGDRLIIEQDGYSEHYRAYWQGARTYKISIPIDSAMGFFQNKINFDDPQDLEMLADLAITGDCFAGVRVIALGRVQ